MPGDASIDKVCDVTVSVNDRSIAVSNGYTYASDRTPKVISISPARGGTQGGTTVTITGTLFDSNINNVISFFILLCIVHCMGFSFR